MFAKVLSKIDVFVPVYIVTAFFLAGITIFTFKNVFSAITQANEIEQEIPDSQLKVDKNKLNDAYNVIEDVSVVSLNIK